MPQARLVAIATPTINSIGVQGRERCISRSPAKNTTSSAAMAPQRSLINHEKLRASTSRIGRSSLAYLRASCQKEQERKGASSAPAQHPVEWEGVAGARELTAYQLPLARQIAAGTRRPLLRSHEGIGPLGRWDEILLDGSRGNPTHQVEGRARLVV